MFRVHLEAPVLMAKFLRGKVKKTGHTVGIGRHTTEEIAEFMMNDLRQLSTILGTVFNNSKTTTTTQTSCFKIIGNITSTKRLHTVVIYTNINIVQVNIIVFNSSYIET